MGAPRVATKLVIPDHRLDFMEDKDNPAWDLGALARRNGNPRRLNIFPLGTDHHAQWDYGWEAERDIRVRPTFSMGPIKTT
jgi:hypothetical protein